MMKHISRYAGISVLGISLSLTGCGANAITVHQQHGTSSSGAASTSVQTITYWYWLDDPSSNTTQQLINIFNKTHPSIHVVGKLIPFNEYQQDLINAVASGNAPDVARFKDWWVGQFATNGLLAPLDSYIKVWKYRSDIHERYWDTGKTVSKDSPIYMIPNEYITFYLYYRKDLFDKAHLSPPKTFSQFEMDAKKLTIPSLHQYGFAMRGGSGGQDQWLAFMLAGGARVLDSNGHIVINNAKANEVNQWYINLFTKDHVSPSSAVTDSYSELLADFENGTVAMMAHHIGSYELLKQQLGNKLGVVPMPQANPSDPATLGSMCGNVILSSSKVRAADWEFISWLSSPQAINILDRSPNAQLPVLTSVANESYFQNDPAWRIAISEEKYAIDWPPLSGVGAVAGHVWQQNFDRALLNQETSQDMLNQIASALQNGQ